jgi:pyruvate formate lyase activating enzyme
LKGLASVIIGGFQRFSLLDYPGKLSAIVFTQGCNFRCPYCHNPDLVDPLRYQLTIPEEEILAFLKQRKGRLGAVTITGGEPTLQKALLPFIRKVKAMDYVIKLDTNGSKPEVLSELINLGLIDYVAMDLKAPMHLYPVVTQVPIDGSLIRESMDIIRNSGLDYEFRTTLFDKLLGWSDIDQIKSLLHPGDKYYIQQCRYNDTLIQLGEPDNKQIESVFPHLSDDPVGKDFVRWGKDNKIKIRIRSL